MWDPVYKVSRVAPDISMEGMRLQKFMEGKKGVYLRTFHSLSDTCFCVRLFVSKNIVTLDSGVCRNSCCMSPFTLSF